MAWESISTTATVVTTLVIAATAVAALIQIRQLKLATQRPRCGALAVSSPHAK